MKKKNKIDEFEYQWTLKKILIRFFAYPFSILIIFSGIEMTLNPTHYRSRTAGILAIIIALIYIFSDLIIIFKNRKIKK